MHVLLLFVQSYLPKHLNCIYQYETKLEVKLVGEKKIGVVHIFKNNKFTLFYPIARLVDIILRMGVETWKLLRSRAHTSNMATRQRGCYGLSPTVKAYHVVDEEAAFPAEPVGDPAPDEAAAHPACQVRGALFPYRHRSKWLP